MFRLNRRQFLGAGAALLAAGPLLQRSLPALEKAGERRMKVDLVCGAIGVRAGQLEAIDLAQRHGFESVAPSAQFLAGLSEGELKEILALLKAKGLVFGAAGLPVEFRAGEARFEEDLKSLDGYGRGLERAGVTRIDTWIRPAHRTLTYLENFRQHATRLRRAAQILAAHGLRLGLEYVGPKTSWSSSKYPFIHTLAETRELIAEINVPGVGFVLDSWHWYTSGETEADILSLKNEDVVAVDLSDAPAGVPVDQQIDNRRELPAATGVIDLASFLNALAKIGYDGPVRAEPFNAALRELSTEEAVAATAQAMKKAFALIRT